MVQPDGDPHATALNLRAPAGVQQGDAELAAIPSDRVCVVGGVLLAVHPAVPDSVGHGACAGGALLPAHGVWGGNPVPRRTAQSSRPAVAQGLPCEIGMVRSSF
jgi:hypothetical protein